MSHLTRRLPSPAMLVALLALFVALSGTAIAANGGNFILGQSNSAGKQTSLTANRTGPALQLTNTNTAAVATPLNLVSAVGKAPFTTSSTTKVANLNADMLDGLDAAAFDQAQSRLNVFAFGPFPQQFSVGSFTTTGGQLLFMVASSGYSTATQHGLTEYLVLCTSEPCSQANAVGTIDMFGFTNEALSHKSLLPSFEMDALAAGTYYVNIVPDAATHTDQFDTASILIVEF